MRAIGVLLTCVLSMVLFACSGASSSPVGQSNLPSTCTPGHAIACVGPGACQGGQTCSDDGMSFSECICGAQPQDDAGSNSDGAVNGDGAVPPNGDAANADGNVDTDAGTDANANTCDLSSCSGDTDHCFVPVCKDGSCALAAAKENTACENNTGRCDANGHCVICGTDNATCCAGPTGPTCNYGFGCNESTNICFACGQANQVCCPGQKCLHSNLICNAQGFC